MTYHAILIRIPNTKRYWARCRNFTKVGRCYPRCIELRDRKCMTTTVRRIIRTFKQYWTLRNLLEVICAKVQGECSMGLPSIMVCKCAFTFCPRHIRFFVGIYTEYQSRHRGWVASSIALNWYSEPKEVLITYGIPPPSKLMKCQIFKEHYWADALVNVL